jgi:hypothetical protein
MVRSAYWRNPAVLAGAVLAVACVSAGGAARAGVVTAGPEATARAEALALLRLPATAIRPARGPAWSPTAMPAGGAAIPRPGSSSELEGVYCTSAASCWAVGNYEKNGANLDQVVHWNGKKWSEATVPSPGGTASGDVSELFGVRCVSAKACWAVGTYEKNYASLGQALRWDGKRWSRVTVPDPGGILSGDFTELFDVSCTSASSCWAAGEYGSYGTVSEVILNLALRWNGKRWARVTTPEPGGTGSDEANALDAIRCQGPRNCWGVGTYGTIGSSVTLLNEALHWNGAKWSETAIASPGGTSGTGDFSELDGLSCTSAANCWAAGAYGTMGAGETTLNQVVHWNGTLWSLVAAPDPGGTSAGAGNTLIAISCSSARNCWAAGDLGNFTSSEYILNQALHWNGTSWSVKSTPDPGGAGIGDLSSLNGIRCVGPADCWAAGVQQHGGGTDRNQILHWNGTKWSAAG